MPPHLEDRRHIPALDGLRGVAILMVMACHFTQHIAGDGRIGRALAEMLHAGRHGVDLFFVLSGFLITGILLDARGAPAAISRFFARRILRIFPLYFSVLVGCLVVIPLMVSPESLGTRSIQDHQLGLWLYYSNLEMAWSGEWLYEGRWLHLAHFWSLAVEEQFYLAWPFIIAALAPRTLLGLCVAIVVEAIIIRAVLSAAGVPSSSIFLLTPCRLDALAVGALVAGCIRDEHWRQTMDRAATPIVVAAAIVIALIFSVGASAPILTQTLKYTALAWFFAAILVLSLRPGSLIARSLSRDSLRFFGRYSYGIYVFHALLVPVYLATFGPAILSPLLGSTWLGNAAYAVLACAASTCCALVSWWTIEARMLGLKRSAPMPTPGCHSP